MIDHQPMCLVELFIGVIYDGGTFILFFSETTVFQILDARISKRFLRILVYAFYLLFYEFNVRRPLDDVQSKCLKIKNNSIKPFKYLTYF